MLDLDTLNVETLWKIKKLNGMDAVHAAVNTVLEAFENFIEYPYVMELGKVEFYYEDGTYKWIKE